MKTNTQKIAFGAMFLAVALLLPFLTGQIPQIGQMLLPMHFPVLLAGFVCGGPIGAVVGFTAPLLRYLIFGMPPIYPVGIAMAFELMVYGLLTGILYKLFPKNIYGTIGALLIAMVGGRAVWGIVQLILTFINPAADPFTFSAFIGGAIMGSIPGIIAQLVLIPLIVVILRKTKVIE